MRVRNTRSVRGCSSIRGADECHSVDPDDPELAEYIDSDILEEIDSIIVCLCNSDFCNGELIIIIIIINV